MRSFEGQFSDNRPLKRTREEKQRLRSGLVEVVVYSAVWGAFGALLVAAAGAVFLWGVLIANAAR